MRIFSSKSIYRKAIPFFLFLLMFVVRFLTFYEISGILTINGWGAVKQYGYLFIAASLLYCSSVWMSSGKYLLQIFMQIISVIIMLISEFLYLYFSEYYVQIKYLQQGFWIYLCICMFTIIYNSTAQIICMENSIE